MELKRTLSLLLPCCALIAATALALYFHFNGQVQLETTIEQNSVVLIVEFSTDTTKNIVLGENFQGILTTCYNDGINVGNLTYHQHIANLNDQEAMKHLKSKSKTYQLIIGT